MCLPALAVPHRAAFAAPVASSTYTLAELFPVVKYVREDWFPRTVRTTTDEPERGAR